MRSAHAGAPVHPRRRWYWLAGCLLAAAATCMQPGGYVLYIERPGSCCSFNIGGGNGGDSGDGPPFPSWSRRVALLQVSNASQVPISTWRGATESYAAAGVQGQAAMYFTIRSPGQYNLTASDVAPRSIADIAAGRGIGHSVLIEVLLIAAGLLIFGPAGLLIGGITAYRRRRARRTLAAPPWNVPAGVAAAAGASAGWQPGPAQVPSLPVNDDAAGRASQAPGYETAQATPAWAPSAAGGPYQGSGGPAGG